MSESNESYSSKKAEITRVKSRKKIAKKTVGITLPPHIIKEARNHNLNISRITEQALSSILDYLKAQKNSESSKSFGEAFLQRKGSKPRWPSWLGHRLGKAEVAGSNPARGSTIAVGTC